MVFPEMSHKHESTNGKNENAKVEREAEEKGGSTKGKLKITGSIVIFRLIHKA